MSVFSVGGAGGVTVSELLFSASVFSLPPVFSVFPVFSLFSLFSLLSSVTIPGSVFSVSGISGSELSASG